MAVNECNICLCRLAVEKIRSMDDAFRRQLDSAEESHQRAMDRLEQEQQQELAYANKRVIQIYMFF